MLPLQGIRIVDWTINQAGPCATMLLADLGAEVIKIETTDGGEAGRGGANVAGTNLGLANGLSYTFEVYNRNKKSMAIDLSTQEGKEIIYALTTVSDVFVQNLRTGVATRLGLGYEDIRQHNPNIIYANCSGYGHRGPRASSPATTAFRFLARGTDPAHAQHATRSRVSYGRRRVNRKSGVKRSSGASGARCAFCMRAPVD